jgi:gamma-glutamyl:cysteine ligase YbdK (ATP-grasp superfamily)
VGEPAVPGPEDIARGIALADEILRRIDADEDSSLRAVAASMGVDDVSWLVASTIRHLADELAARNTELAGAHEALAAVIRERDSFERQLAEARAEAEHRRLLVELACEELNDTGGEYAKRTADEILEDLSNV